MRLSAGGCISFGKFIDSASPIDPDGSRRFRDTRVLILPVFLIVVGVIGGLVTSSLAGHGFQAMHEGPLRILLPVTLGTALAANWVITGLVVYRLWAVGRRPLVRIGRKNDPYSPAIRAFVESGALYSITTLIFLVAYGLRVCVFAPS